MVVVVAELVNSSVSVTPVDFFAATFTHRNFRNSFFSANVSAWNPHLEPHDWRFRQPLTIPLEQQASEAVVPPPSLTNESMSTALTKADLRQVEAEEKRLEKEKQRIQSELDALQRKKKGGKKNTSKGLSRTRSPRAPQSPRSSLSPGPLNRGRSRSLRKSFRKVSLSGRCMHISKCLCFANTIFLVAFFLSWMTYSTLDADYEIAQRVIDKLSDGYMSGLNETVGIATEPRPGQILAAEGRRKHFPVVFVPGVISSGLEVWKGKPCAESMFRKRMWGTASMMSQLAFKPDCWIEHIMLNRTNWQDPDGIKLRASSGLGAADYFITGYNLWGKLIQNLADVGYDEQSMYLAAYDWRLA